MATTLASTTITVAADEVCGVAQWRPTAAAVTDAIEHLVESRLARICDQPRPEVLLQGLVCLGRTATQDPVRLFRDVFHLNGGHGAILAPHGAAFNPRFVDGSGRLQARVSRLGRLAGFEHGATQPLEYDTLASGAAGLVGQRSNSGRHR